MADRRNAAEGAAEVLPWPCVGAAALGAVAGLAFVAWAVVARPAPGPWPTRTTPPAPVAEAPPPVLHNTEPAPVPEAAEEPAPPAPREAAPAPRYAMPPRPRQPGERAPECRALVRRYALEPIGPDERDAVAAELRVVCARPW